MRPGETRPHSIGHLDRWPLVAAVRPQCDELDALRITEHTVIEEVPDSHDMNSPYVFKFNVGSAMTAVRCNADDTKDALKFFANSVRGGLAVPPPP
jgi:hypothetical protein